jgi:hypothetical protein
MQPGNSMQFCVGAAGQLNSMLEPIQASSFNIEVVLS